jgi:hypothetical protein
MLAIHLLRFRRTPVPGSWPVHRNQLNQDSRTCPTSLFAPRGGHVCIVLPRACCLLLLTPQGEHCCTTVVGPKLISGLPRVLGHMASQSFLACATRDAQRPRSRSQPRPNGLPPTRGPWEALPTCTCRQPQVVILLLPQHTALMNPLFVRLEPC